MEDLANRLYKHTWLIAVLTLTVILSPSSGSAGESDIVRDGQAMMVITIPDKAVEVVRRAAWEFQYHVKESSGVTLEIVSESAEPQTKKGHIYLGACKATEQAGIVTDKLTRNGFIIRTVGTDIFLVGRDAAGPWHVMDWPLEHGTLLAVYDFLDSQMGVRWLWPGKLGEVIPKSSTICIDGLDKTVSLPLISSRYYAYQWDDGWASREVHNQFKEDENLWMLRHYFSWDSRVRGIHSFEKYWDRFSESHPEYFNLLPDGTRRSDPHYVAGGSPMYISMCVSEPGLWRQIVEDWKANRTERNPYLYIGENDTPGRCCCPRCMSWDVPYPELDIPWEKRLEYAKRDFAKESDGWYTNLGSLSDRYARFYSEVLKLAKQVDPDVLALGFSYANYGSPAIRAKLDKNIIVNHVGRLMYPWTREKVRRAKEDWIGWADTGASLMWRPNFMLDGHNMPVFFARKFDELFSYFYKRNMLATYFDSNTGQYSTQGPNLYVLARRQYAVDKSLDEILDEYYGAFGPAETAVREYFSHWEKVSDAVTDQDINSYAAQQEMPEGGHYGHFYVVAPVIFTPTVMAEGRAILEKAVDVAKGDNTASARVAYLQKGLKNAELTLAAQNAYRIYQTSGDASACQRAIEMLDNYRASVESDNIANMGRLHRQEGRSWDRSFLKFSGKPGIDLDTKWKFMWDPENKGISNNWHTEEFDDSEWLDINVDSCWEDQEVGRKWKQTHGKDYDGYAWYRNQFVVTSTDQPRKFVLAFGAVDEACKIWVNGQFVLDRPFPYKGNKDSWTQAFEVDISEHVRYDQPNTVAVRVEDNSGAGGIWRSAKLLVLASKKKDDAVEETFMLWQLPSQTGGQMNSYVIKTVHDKIVVIDGGFTEDAGYLKGFLEALGNDVDMWFISHQHLDHICALTAILENPGDLKIDHIYGSMLDEQWVKANESEGTKTTIDFTAALRKAGKEVTELELGQVIEIDGVSIEILGIENPEIVANAINNSSVVMRVWDDKKSILFTGDLGIEGGNKLLNSKYKKRLKSDYVQMAHHGQNGVTKEFYEAVGAEHCIWPTPLWLWDNNNGGGKGSGPWVTLEVRGWMDELGVKTHYCLFDGLQRIQ